VGRQIRQRDLAPFSFRDLHSREVLDHRVVQGHFTATDHLSECQRREKLGDRADLEHGVFGKRPPVLPTGRSIGHDPAAFGIDDADHHADALPVCVDALGE
jgi:hypothetical protein